MIYVEFIDKLSRCNLFMAHTVMGKIYNDQL